MVPAAEVAGVTAGCVLVPCLDNIWKVRKGIRRETSVPYRCGDDGAAVATPNEREKSRSRDET